MIFPCQETRSNVQEQKGQSIKDGLSKYFMFYILSSNLKFKANKNTNKYILGATTVHALNRSMRMLLQNSFCCACNKQKKLAIFAKINR